MYVITPVRFDQVGQVAQVVELVDTQVSGTCGRKVVDFLSDTPESDNYCSLQTIASPSLCNLPACQISIGPK